MFSSNDTPAEDFELAAKLGAIINLDDISHIGFLEKVAGKIPETICCRFNTGGEFKISTSIMDTPGEAKYGFTREQLTEGFKLLKKKKAQRLLGFMHFLPAIQRQTSIIRRLQESFLRRQ